MGPSRPWSPTRRRLRTRGRRAKVKPVCVFPHFHRRLRQRRRFNLVAMAPRSLAGSLVRARDTIATRFLWPLTYAGPIRAPVTVAVAQMMADCSHNPPRNLAFSVIRRVRMDSDADGEWAGGRVVEGARCGFMARVLMLICCCCAVVSLFLPNERLTNGLRWPRAAPRRAPRRSVPLRSARGRVVLRQVWSRRRRCRRLHPTFDLPGAGLVDGAATYGARASRATRRLRGGGGALDAEGSTVTVNHRPSLTRVNGASVGGGQSVVALKQTLRLIPCAVQ